MACTGIEIIGTTLQFCFRIVEVTCLKKNHDPKSKTTVKNMGFASILGLPQYGSNLKVICLWAETLLVL